MAKQLVQSNLMHNGKLYRRGDVLDPKAKGVDMDDATITLLQKQRVLQEIAAGKKKEEKAAVDEAEAEAQKP